MPRPFVSLNFCNADLLEARDEFLKADESLPREPVYDRGDSGFPKLRATLLFLEVLAGY